MNARTLCSAALVMVVACAARADVIPPNPKETKHLVTETRAAMGTEVTFRVWTADDDGAHRAMESAFAEIARLERMMTTWREDSEISRINANAGVEPVHVSAEVIEVLEMANRVSRLSGGVFDVTFEALHGAWKFDDDLEKRVPDRAELAKRLPFIDYKQIKIDEHKKTVFLAKKGMKMNLGGIAKGYAVDRAAAVLKRAGFPDAIVQAGGDLLCMGSKDGQPWTAGIRDPRAARGEVFAMIRLIDHAFSTAGDYERFFILDGKRYHHILDPRTGFPATASRSVTIYAKTALLADGLDDAVFILGWKKGLELIEAFPDVGAVVVDDHGEVHLSKRMEGAIKIVHPPTDAP
jgi:thiamine biosynthesis lipoprotein